MLATSKPFRHCKEAELINFSQTNALLECSAENELSVDIKVLLSQFEKKQIFKNGIKLKKATELFGVLNVVLFTPDDLYLLKAGSSDRRRFIDFTLSQILPRYFMLIKEYSKVLENKSKILRAYYEKPSLLTILPEYNQKIAELSAEIISYRLLFIKELNELAGKIHSNISGEKEELILYYKTINDPTVQNISYQIETQYQNELRSGICLVGTHRDDFTAGINGKEVKTFASQGQTRTAALALKLAEREIIKKNIGGTPIMLLDDVLSDLDDKRQQYIIEKISEGQVFLSACHLDEKLQKNAKVFNI